MEGNKSNQPVLELKNFYFKSCKIERKASLCPGKIDFDLGKKITHEEKNLYEVLLLLRISKDTELAMEITAIARFEYAGAEEKKKTILEQNTVAIMYPYLRAEVSLLTSQPEMMPIVLPVINTSNIRNLE